MQPLHVAINRTSVRLLCIRPSVVNLSSPRQAPSTQISAPQPDLTALPSICSLRARKPFRKPRCCNGAGVMEEGDVKVLVTHRKVLTESYVLGNGAPSFPANVCAVCIPSTAPWTLEDSHGRRWQGKITQSAKRAVLSTGWAALFRGSGARVGDAVEFVFLPGNVLRLVRQSQEQRQQQQDLAARLVLEQQPQQQQTAIVAAASPAHRKHDPRGLAALLSTVPQAQRRGREQHAPHPQQPERQQGEQRQSSQAIPPPGYAAAKRRRCSGASAAQAHEESHPEQGSLPAQCGSEAASAPACEAGVRLLANLPGMRCMGNVQRGPQVSEGSADDAAGGGNGKATLREEEPGHAGERLHSSSSSGAYGEGTSDLTQARVAGVVGGRGDETEAVPAVPSVRSGIGRMARARQLLRRRRSTGGGLAAQGLSALQRNAEDAGTAPGEQNK